MALGRDRSAAESSRGRHVLETRGENATEASDRSGSTFRNTPLERIRCIGALFPDAGKNPRSHRFTTR